MKMLSAKYKARISLLFLSAYLFTFIVGIIHYHNFEFCSTDTIKSERNPVSNHFPNLGGSVNECVIQQNLISLQTAVINLFIEHPFIPYNSIPFQNATMPFNINSVHLTDNLLRAPPSLS